MDMVKGELVAGVLSREELRFAFVDEQGWDASCGYAALASLLKRYRGVSIDEEGLLKQSELRGGAVVKVSLAELARLSQERGLEARAWRMDYDQLLGASMELPLLVHYDRPRGHFALLLRVGPEGVVVADPSRGLELLTRQQFGDRWSGVALEVVDPAQPARGASAVETAADSALGRARLIDRALATRP